MTVKSQYLRLATLFSRFYQKNYPFITYQLRKMKNTERLNNLLNKLEKYNVYLYDNGSALYFMHTPTERKTRFFRNNTKNLPQIIEDFAENMLQRFENTK